MEVEAEVEVEVDATSALPSETAATAQGLPADTDRIVRELDVYLCNGELGGGTQVREGARPASGRMGTGRGGGGHGRGASQVSRLPL